MCQSLKDWKYMINHEFCAKNIMLMKIWLFYRSAYNDENKKVYEPTEEELEKVSSVHIHTCKVLYGVQLKSSCSSLCPDYELIMYNDFLLTDESTKRTRTVK